MRKRFLVILSFLALLFPGFSMGPPSMAVSTLFLSGCFEDACDRAEDEIKPQCDQGGGTVVCDGSKELFVDKCECRCVYP